MKDNLYHLANGGDTWTPAKGYRHIKQPPGLPVAAHFAEEYRRERERRLIKKMAETLRRHANELHDRRARFIATATRNAVAQACGDLISAGKSWKVILRETARKHNMSVEAICAPSRRPSLVLARQEACYRLRSETALSYPQIAEVLGGRDHTTILHGVRKHAERHGLPLPGAPEPQIYLEAAE